MPADGAAVTAQVDQTEQHNPRPIKEFLECTDDEITSNEEFAKLNELDQRYHVTRFEDDEGREYTGQTVEENMNR